ncbi:MAG TPA: hypothetical protein ENI70_01750 [Candidatus Peregrinibacteria bacterium]|nr:hypothetical protein [Candidatus Peregrinibacteria bacterium]
MIDQNHLTEEKPISRSDVLLYTKDGKGVTLWLLTRLTNMGLTIEEIKNSTEEDLIKKTATSSSEESEIEKNCQNITEEIKEKIAKEVSQKSPKN